MILKALFLFRMMTEPASAVAYLAPLNEVSEHSKAVAAEIAAEIEEDLRAPFYQPKLHLDPFDPPYGAPRKLSLDERRVRALESIAASWETMARQRTTQTSTTGDP